MNYITVELPVGPAKQRKQILMQKVYQCLSFILVTCCLVNTSATAQINSNLPDTSQPTSIDVNLENLFSQKIPRKYKITAIAITGNKFFDAALLTSVANINVGDEVTIPGGDNFSKAINNLWKQN